MTSMNPAYHPAVTDPFERSCIANGLVTKLISECREVADFKASIREFSIASEDEIAASIARHTEYCQQLYALVCKWVPTPMPWEFYTHWLDTSTVGTVPDDLRQHGVDQMVTINEAED